jgi:hypothetical protein
MRGFAVAKRHASHADFQANRVDLDQSVPACRNHNHMVVLT